MTWFLLALLALAALAPLGIALWRPVRLRGRREADIALYRAQIAELDRDKAAGRLDEAAHRAAVVELQRRLLGAPQDAAPGAVGAAAAPPAPRRSPALLAALFLIPALGLGIYLVRGAPGVPSAPHAERSAVAARDEALLAQLRARIAQLDQTSETARQGYVLLGNAELSRGQLDAAAAAWARALAIRFDPALAADMAELELQRDRTEAAIALLERALAEAPDNLRLRFLSGVAQERAGNAEAARSVWQSIIDSAPPDAPWRAMIQRRMDRLP